MVKVSGKQKIKLANKKYQHDKKRRDKARNEKRRTAQAVEKRGALKNIKRKQEDAYVHSLGIDF